MNPLESERLLLAVPEREDAGELLDYAVRNDAHLAPWSPPRPAHALTLESTLRRIDTMQAEAEANKTLRLWMRLRTKPGGRFIGSVSLQNIQLGPFRACTLGYHLDHEEVGHGYMTEAVGVAIRYAFDELKLHRIMANYVSTNERSGRLLRRLGFLVEGYARDYLFIGGTFKDHVLTALTNHELADAERLCTPVD